MKGKKGRKGKKQTNKKKIKERKRKEKKEKGKASLNKIWCRRALTMSLSNLLFVFFQKG